MATRTSLQTAEDHPAFLLPLKTQEDKHRDLLAWTADNTYRCVSARSTSWRTAYVYIERICEAKIQFSGHGSAPVILAIQEAEAGGTQVQGQPGQLSETMSQNEK